MKKIILISVLFVVTFGFGQNSKEFDFEEFDFKDLKNITSAKLFKKFCFDKGFRKVKNLTNKITYAQGYESDNEVAFAWATYFTDLNIFSITLYRNYNGRSDKSFDNVLNQVKFFCKFYDFKDHKNDEFICYSCPSSSYKGKIGFLRGEDFDIIQTFDF